MASESRLRQSSKLAGAGMAERRSRIGELLGTIRPLTARSVLATALLGANEPRLRVAELIAAASLFGIGAGATRTCLSRMVANGELTNDDATYALTGHLLERWHRIDDVARRDESAARPWDGTWELAIVVLERRAAADRLKLRKAATTLHLAEIREGVWIRPGNLDPLRLPSSRAVLDEQCVYFRRAGSDLTVDAAKSLFAVDAWSRDAKRLALGMEDELRTEPTSPDDVKAALTYQFALSIAVVRHLELDPLLPVAFLPDGWAAATLRSTYRRFDTAFKRRMNRVLRQSAG